MLVLKAYGANVKVREWKEEPKAKSAGVSQAQRRTGPVGSVSSADDGDGIHTVKVAGFGKMTAEDIKDSESVLVDRLESHIRHGGPLAKSPEVKQKKRAGAKPFVVATFANANGALR